MDYSRDLLCGRGMVLLTFSKFSCGDGCIPLRLASSVFYYIVRALDGCPTGYEFVMTSSLVDHVQNVLSNRIHDGSVARAFGVFLLLWSGTSVVFQIAHVHVANESVFIKVPFKKGFLCKEEEAKNLLESSIHQTIQLHCTYLSQDAPFCTSNK